MNQQAQNRNGAGAQRRIRALAGALALFISGALVSPVQAGPNDPPRRDDPRLQQQQPSRGAEARWGTADPRSFEARAEEQRRILQENANNAEITRRMSGLTADERASLRQQINAAGKEVYSNPPAPRR